MTTVCAEMGIGVSVGVACVVVVGWCELDLGGCPPDEPEDEDDEPPPLSELPNRSASATGDPPSKIAPAIAAEVTHDARGSKTIAAPSSAMTLT